ncbi:MAG TPA: hypothetical protein VH599_14990 [Ktedonobacterales bacterium]
MVLVAPPSRRPTLRQGERLPCGPTHQQASVEPPGGTRERPTGARGRGNSSGPRPSAARENAGTRFPQGPLPKGGGKRPFPKGGGATSGNPR